jgi:hypothetical protein
MDIKKIILTIVGIAISFTVLYGVYLLTNEPVQKNLPKTNEVVLYWGEGCPHCENVEAYLKENPQIDSKLKIVRKEVYKNQVNAKDLQLKADICNFD